MKTEQGTIKFTELFTGICELFDKEYSKTLMNIYYEALKNYPIEKVQEAVNKVVLTCKFFPKPADFIEHLEVKQISSSSKAEIQADVVLKVLKYQGRNANPVFEDTITQHLMTTRWRYKSWAANVVDDELKWWVKEFKEAYQAYEEQGGVKLIEGSEKVKQLIGNIGG